MVVPMSWAHFYVHLDVHISTALWIFVSDMAIILSIPEAYTEWLEKLKGLSHEKGLVKSAENISTSPFNEDQSIHTTFSQIHLAG